MARYTKERNPEPSGPQPQAPRNDAPAQMAGPTRKSAAPEHGPAGPASRKVPTRVGHVAFALVALGIMAAPLALTPVVPTTSSAEKRELAAWPAPVTESGAPNVDYLQQAGDWFDDHYAFRNQLVDANARLRAGVFGTSAAQNVIVGTDGWLYYRGSVLDYTGQSAMSDRAVWNAGHNLRLASEYVQSRGGRLVVAIAPDKTTVCPDHLPYYVREGEGASNLERVQDQLSAGGVSYVDLRPVLTGADHALYRREDTHWTAEGAALAANAIMDQLGHEHKDMTAGSVSTMRSAGDLATMLYPTTAQPEEVPRYDDAWRFSYANGATSPEDSTVQTTSVGGGTLVMYRDSFGNALLPFMASSYGSASFSRMIPYNLAAVGEGSDVVILRAERHVASFATRPAYLPAPERDASVVASAAGASTQTTLKAEGNGPYVELKGSVDARYLPADATVYVTVKGADGAGHTYECYGVSSTEGQVADAEGADENDPIFQGDAGYLAYLPAEACPTSEATVDVTVATPGGATRVLSAQVDFGAVPKG